VVGYPLAGLLGQAVTVFPSAGFGAQSVSCCVASSSAPIICGADFAGWFCSKQSFAIPLGSGCIGAGAMPSGIRFLSCNDGAVPSGTSFLKALCIAFVAVAVGFVVLHPIGIAVSNLNASIALGDGSPNGWLDASPVWCHACSSASICQPTPVCFIADSMVMVDGAVDSPCSNGNLFCDGVGVSGNPLHLISAIVVCSMVHGAGAHFDVRAPSCVHTSCSGGNGMNLVIVPTPCNGWQVASCESNFNGIDLANSVLDFSGIHRADSEFCQAGVVHPAGSVVV
jgi:hypothetical protein